MLRGSRDLAVKFQREAWESLKDYRNHVMCVRNLWCLDSWGLEVSCDL